MGPGTFPKQFRSIAKAPTPVYTEKAWQRLISKQTKPLNPPGRPSLSSPRGTSSRLSPSVKSPHRGPHGSPPNC
ncbi:hypothetical protein PSAC2689_70017 [Paraburkholderia sacchari]